MTRHSTLLLALLLAGSSALAPGCGPKRPPLEKDAQGRTILVSEADAEPVEEQRRRRQDVLHTKDDDRRVGGEGARAVEAQIGVLGDAALDEYVQALGDKLLRGVPRRFEYRFRVVDQVEPNAFALPGGHIFVSRGLLALARSEDELANVIGHEISHVVRRHAATRQAIERHRTRFIMPWIRAGQDAAYSRDMERQADKEGQMLAAAAGYDPGALSTFLASLGKAERLARGSARPPSMFDTHPGTTERVASNAMRAAEIRWHRDPALGDTRSGYLERIEGLPYGDRPESGVFQGSRFLHPVLGFQMRFPEGWRTANSAGSVGAIAPDRQAQVFLEPDKPWDDATAAAKRYVAELEKEIQSVKVLAFDPQTIAGHPGARLELIVGGRIHALVAFFAYEGVHFRATGVTPARLMKGYRNRLLSAIRSFRPLAPGDARGIVSNRIRLVDARNGENLAALCARSECAPNTAPATAVMNGVGVRDHFGFGDIVKIVRAEPWTPPER
ncbi:MAG: M48 family metalloprotease [Myxococcota bacterium]